MSDQPTDLLEALDDIERLRTRIEELESDAIHNEGVMVALREGYTGAKDRIEEYQTEIGEMQRVNFELGQRVEELERERDDAASLADDLACKLHDDELYCPGHHITNEQIAAAWENRIMDYDTDIMYVPAEDLGIKQCNHEWHKHSIPNPEAIKGATWLNECPSCNGDGYTIGGE